MSKDHGLAGLFGDDGELIANSRSKEAEAPTPAPAPDLPPVLKDADKSPLARLSDQMGYDYAADNRVEDDAFEKDEDPFAPDVREIEEQYL
ncbi:MAG: hypothetical protein V2I43_05595, partial [Parvularcula sp.]|nr:hypothetical protein [Parvularcula sp.]